MITFYIKASAPNLNSKTAEQQPIANKEIVEMAKAELTADSAWVVVSTIITMRELKVLTENKMINLSEGLPVFECKRCNVFSTDGSVSTAEQEQQMKGHLEAAHPYWDLENLGAGAQGYKANFRLVNRQRREYFCTRCKTVISPKTSFCPNCGAYKTAFSESDEEKEELGRTGLHRKQLFGIIGSILLFLGVFTPIISAPLVGSINYFQNGKGDRVIVLVLAVISIGLVLAKKI